MKTIYFANHAQFEGRYTNLGDWAIFEQMIGQFEPDIADGKCRVVVASSDPEFTAANYPVTAFQRGGLKGILETLKWLKQSDVIVIGGGEIVQDLSSMVYIPYQLLRPLVGSLFGKKLFAYAIGVGEPWEISTLGRLEAKFVLNRFDVITVRDRKSYKVLKDYIGVNKPKIYQTADPALNLEAKETDADVSEKPYIVMSVRSVYHRTRSLLPFSIRKKLNLVPKVYYSEIDIFKDKMAEIADYMIDQYHCNVLFLNTYTGKSMSANDDAFSADVMSRISEKNQKAVKVIDGSLHPCQIKKVLGGAELIVSVPLHPLILGASEGVPSISLAYASKSMCFMKEAGMKKYIHHVVKLGQAVDEAQIMMQIDEIFKEKEAVRKKMNGRVDRLKKEETKNILLLKELAELE